LLSQKEGVLFFSGGHLEFGESIPDALFREIKEELGIKIKKFSLFS
jgi:8-oxo-dGTP pyrophosphatase MutT (NUDIX family)